MERQTYSAKHYQENKAKYVARAKANNKLYRERNKQFLKELKESTPCTDCGGYFPYYVMDFDHVHGKKKTEVSTIRANASSLAALKREMVKCELVCSNCHRIRSHRRLMS